MRDGTPVTGAFLRLSVARVINSTIGSRVNRWKQRGASPHGIPSTSRKAPLGQMSLGGGDTTNTIQ